MILTSERISADRAHSLGMVNEVVDSGSALARALELAASIAAQPELAVRIAATVARVVADGGDIEAALAAERIGGALLFGTQDAHHAVRTWSARGD